MSESREIVIKGAREHNLRNISITIPRDKLVVFTGLSGSGKSSLAFDTIYAEGQRRYLESLSAYARQFMEQMGKPDVDSIDGLSPSISIEQKNISRSPRSTVGTVTEIYDFMRLLWARTGLPYCYSCGKPIQSQTISQITDQILQLPQGSKFAVLAPIVRGKKGEYQKELLDLRSQGFVRARIDGNEVNLSVPLKLQKSLKHDISIYIDRLILRPGVEARLSEALEIAEKLAGGVIELEIFQEKNEIRFYSTKFACPTCGTSFPEIEPRNFSFNSPHGACAKCNGVGSELQVDPHLVVPDPNLSLLEGAIHPWRDKEGAWKDAVLRALSRRYNFSVDTPFKSLPQRIKEILLYGAKDEPLEFKYEAKGKTLTFEEKFEGVVTALNRQLTTIETDEEGEDPEGVSEYADFSPCAECRGTRLKQAMLYVRVGGRSIADVAELSVLECETFFKSLKLTKAQMLIAEPILKEIQARLAFLENVGLSYLSLSRSAATLSGGEAQRIRLATQIGSHLVGVLYVLDEPSIGLHQRDNEKLIRTLETLRDQGNSVVVVEHDEETIRRADFVVDLGPGAGTHGGYIVFAGDPKKLERTEDSLTGKYLTGALEIPVPAQRRAINPERVLKIREANVHNLKHIDVDFPLGLFICVTGVSGSGKSTLVLDTLHTAVENHFSGFKDPRILFKSIEGLQHLERVIYVDQNPIGRTPRSNPATYTGLFGDIRTLFAELPDAKMRGYTASRFSFNVSGGRCEACSGDGTLRITMHFLPDVFVPCEVCQGKRYNRETLEVRYREKNIADVLQMNIEEAATFFERVPSLRTKLKTLLDVGLGYIQLGQNAVTLSGGEAQRIKLSRELNRRGGDRSLYIFDEPTTGLHFDDVKKLTSILHRLVDQGATVLVIEHNLDVIKQADYLIELGPEGGEAGGKVLYQGTPEGLLNVKHSRTGPYLAQTLKRNLK